MTRLLDRLYGLYQQCMSQTGAPPEAFVLSLEDLQTLMNDPDFFLVAERSGPLKICGVPVRIQLRVPQHRPSWHAVSYDSDRSSVEDWAAGVDRLLAEIRETDGGAQSS